MFDNIPELLIYVLGLLLALTVYAPALTADGLPHGHDCATATQIDRNIDVSVAFADSNDLAVYRMVLDQRGLIDIWTDPGSFDVWGIDLLDSSCRPVPGVSAGNSAVTGKYSKITVPSLNLKPADSVWTLGPGVYFLRLHPDPVRVFQEPFTLHSKFTPHYGHDCKTAEKVNPYSSIDGALLYVDDREVFRVTTEKSGRIYAWMTGLLSPAKEPMIGFYFADCSKAIGQLLNDEAGPVIRSTVFEPGTYYVSVEPNEPDSLGSFNLRIEFVPEFLWLEE